MKEIGTITLDEISFPGDKAKNIDFIIGKLNEYGVIAINDFASGQELQALRQDFVQLLSLPNNTWLEKRPYSLGEAVLLSRTEELKMAYPATYKFFDGAFMKEVTKQYRGNEYTANRKIFVVKDVIGSSHHANDLHFDVERTLKFFLYLTDTTAANGAFRSVPGSHKHTEKIRQENGDKISYENREFSRQLPFGQEHAISIDGKAGTLIIFDTDVFHQAGKVSSGERWVMRGQTEAVGKAPAKPGIFQKLKAKFKL